MVHCLPKKRFSLACIMLLIAANSFAQKDSSQNSILLEQSARLQEVQLAHIADSVRIHVLKEELDEVGPANLYKKQQLQGKIKKIEKADSARFSNQKQIIDSLKKIVSGYPVKPFGEVLFSIYTKAGNFTPEERADAVTGKLKDLYKDYFFKADSLKTVPTVTGMEIVYNENIIMSVSASDALWENTNAATLAEQYRKKIIAEITTYKSRTSFNVLFGEALRGLLVLAVLVLIVAGITRLFKFIKLKILHFGDKNFTGLKIYNYALLNVKKQLRLTSFILDTLKWLMILLAVYLTFPVVFSFFPWTEKLTGTLLSYILDPVKSFLNAIWQYLPNLITIAVIIVIFYYLEKLLRFLRDEVACEKLRITGFYPDWAKPTFQIIRILFFAFMLVLIFPYLPGSNSPVFRGISVFLGVLFTFGSSGPLSNSIAGIVLTYMRTFKLGDRVKIGEVVGDVIEKSALIIRIRTIKNEVVSIPNVSAMNSHTINYSSEAKENGLILYTAVTIGYNAPWRKVHELLIEAAKATPLIEKNPEPFVFQTSLNDFFITYQINAYTKYANDQHVTYSLLHQAIQDKFNEAGVEIMSPHYASIRDGNNSSIPSDYLSEKYKSPSFNVQIKKEDNATE